MTRDHLIRAVNEGIPFVIKMADGREYKVVDRYLVSVGQTAVIVTDEHDFPTVLPLLTMTGVTYLKNKAA
jgi:hypothetical protein